MKRMTYALTMLAGTAAMLVATVAPVHADTGDIAVPGQPPAVVNPPPVVVAYFFCKGLYPPGSGALKDCIDRHS